MKINICVVAAVFLLSSLPAFSQEAQDTKSDCGCETEENLVRDDDLGRWIEESSLSYETKDGNLYWWLPSYNPRARSYEESGNEEGLVGYLLEIASSYEFGDESDVDGFVEWALKNRPWKEE